MSSDASPSPATAPYRPETVAVTVGRPEKVVDAPLNPPVSFASTYVGAHDPSTAALGYGRYGNPTWQALEDGIGALEGGRALTFSSGMAAAHAVLELLAPGSTVAYTVETLDWETDDAASALWVVDRARSRRRPARS